MKDFRDIYYNIRREHNHTLGFLNSSIAFIDISNVRKRISKRGEHSYDKFLTDWEHAYINKLKIPKRKIDFLCGRLAGKRAVKRHLLKHADHVEKYDDHSLFKDIEIRRTVTGRPVVFIKDGSGGNGSSSFCISISHTEGVAASLVSNKHDCKGIGIDIEKIEERDESLLNIAFTEYEIYKLKDICKNKDKSDDILKVSIARYWSIKEAVMKSLGVGVNIDLKDIEVIDAHNYSTTVLLKNKALDRFKLLEGTDLKVESAKIREFMVSIACLY